MMQGAQSNGHQEHNGSLKEKSEMQSKGSMVPQYSKMEFLLMMALVILQCGKNNVKFFINRRIVKADEVAFDAFHVLGEEQLWFDEMEQEEIEL